MKRHVDHQKSTEDDKQIKHQGGPGTTSWSSQGSESVPPPCLPFNQATAQETVATHLVYTTNTSSARPDDRKRDRAASPPDRPSWAPPSGERPQEFLPVWYQRAGSHSSSWHDGARYYDKTYNPSNQIGAFPPNVNVEEIVKVEKKRRGIRDQLPYSEEKELNVWNMANTTSSNHFQRNKTSEETTPYKGKTYATNVVYETMPGPSVSPSQSQYSAYTDTTLTSQDETVHHSLTANSKQQIFLATTSNYHSQLSDHNQYATLQSNNRESTSPNAARDKVQDPSYHHQSNVPKRVGSPYKFAQKSFIVEHSRTPSNVTYSGIPQTSSKTYKQRIPGRAVPDSSVKPSYQLVQRDTCGEVPGHSRDRKGNRQQTPCVCAKSNCECKQLTCEARDNPQFSKLYPFITPVHRPTEHDKHISSNKTQWVMPAMSYSGEIRQRESRLSKTKPTTPSTSMKKPSKGSSSKTVAPSSPHKQSRHTSAQRDERRKSPMRQAKTPSRHTKPSSKKSTSRTSSASSRRRHDGKRPSQKSERIRHTESPRTFTYPSKSPAQMPSKQSPHRRHDQSHCGHKSSASLSSKSSRKRGSIHSSHERKQSPHRLEGKIAPDRETKPTRDLYTKRGSPSELVSSKTPETYRAPSPHERHKKSEKIMPESRETQIPSKEGRPTMGSPARPRIEERDVGQSPLPERYASPISRTPPSPKRRDSPSLAVQHSPVRTTISQQPALQADRTPVNVQPTPKAKSSPIKLSQSPPVAVIRDPWKDKPVETSQHSGAYESLVRQSSPTPPRERTSPATQYEPPERHQSPVRDITIQKTYSPPGRTMEAIPDKRKSPVEKPPIVTILPPKQPKTQTNKQNSQTVSQAPVSSNPISKQPTRQTNPHNEGTKRQTPTSNYHEPTMKQTKEQPRIIDVHYLPCKQPEPFPRTDLGDYFPIWYQKTGSKSSDWFDGGVYYDRTYDPSKQVGAFAPNVNVEGIVRIEKQKRGIKDHVPYSETDEPPPKHTKGKGAKRSTKKGKSSKYSVLRYEQSSNTPWEQSDDKKSTEMLMGDNDASSSNYQSAVEKDPLISDELGILPKSVASSVYRLSSVSSGMGWKTATKECHAYTLSTDFKSALCTCDIDRCRCSFKHCKSKERRRAPPPREPCTCDTRACTCGWEPCVGASLQPPTKAAKSRARKSRASTASLCSLPEDRDLCPSLSKLQLPSDARRSRSSSAWFKQKCTCDREECDCPFEPCSARRRVRRRTKYAEKNYQRPVPTTLDDEKCILCRRFAPIEAMYNKCVPFLCMTWIWSDREFTRHLGNPLAPLPDYKDKLPSLKESRLQRHWQERYVYEDQE